MTWDRLREGHKRKARASRKRSSGFPELKAGDIQLGLAFQDGPRENQWSKNLGQNDVVAAEVVVGEAVVPAP